MNRVRVAAACALLCAACNTLLGIEPLPEGGDASVDSTAPDSPTSIIDAGTDAEASDDVTSDDATSDVTVDASNDAPVDAAPPSCDAASIPDGESCTGAPQCGCAGDQTCDYVGGSSLACENAGTSPLGGYCPEIFPSPGTCAPGLICLSGVCHAPCSTIDAPCEDGGTCQGVPTTPHGFNLCMRTSCDLGDAASCGPSDASAPIGCAVIDGVPHVDCLQMGTSTTSCSTGFECAPGWTCEALNDGGRKCFKWCRVGKSDCDAGSSCPSTGSVVVGGVSWSTCN